MKPILVVKSVTLVLAAAALVAADAPSPDARSAAMTALQDNRYADAEQLFRRAAFDENCRLRDPQLVSNVNYLREWTDASFVFQETANSTVSDADRAAVDRAEARDALDEIVRRATDTRIVILNEHHHFPRSRAFAEALARRLRPLGYDVLATETFSNGSDPAIIAKVMDSMTARGYVRQGEGYYTADPVYGDFVRSALALGYRPAVYEAIKFTNTGTSEERMNRRDQDQAENLAEIVRRHPKSRFLVYAGHDHLYERAIGSLRPMGMRLKELTGIDPLTIDQARFMAASLAEPRDPFLARMEAKAKGRSVILFDGKTPLTPGSAPGGVDLLVLHPLLRDRDGRPGWLFATGRKPVKAPANLAPKDGDILLQVFGKDDMADAVPLDQVVWRKGAPVPVLALPSGPVRYATQPMPAAVCPGVEAFEQPMGS